MNILFITHETTRTGAPMMLLHLLRWIHAKHNDCFMTVVSLKKGALSQDFKSVANNLVELEDLTMSTINKTTLQLLKSILFSRPTRNSDQLLIDSINTKDIDVIYANTVVTLQLAITLTKCHPKSKLIAHIHELYVIIEQLAPAFKNYTKAIDHFITPAQIVKDNLVHSYNVPKNKISQVYECSSIAIIPNIERKINKKKSLIIGGSGTVHWRKGSDLFIQVALLFIKLYPNIDVEFRWLGHMPKNEAPIIYHDLRKARLLDKVCFIEESNDPSTVFNEFDLFLMTSREDPFPLVCIEVGLLGIPIICFDGATGTQEVIVDCGIVVPYLDIQEMTLAIHRYMNDDSLYENHSKKAVEVFKNFTPENLCPQYFEVIKTFLND
jgi:glycosyltransferase involved in cell wall biosynthesis